jgi:hypothetical protein
MDLEALRVEVDEMRMDHAEVSVLSRKIGGYIELYRDAIILLVELADNFEIDDPDITSRIDDFLGRVEAYGNPA